MVVVVVVVAQSTKLTRVQTNTSIKTPRDTSAGSWGEEKRLRKGRSKGGNFCPEGGEGGGY